MYRMRHKRRRVRELGGAGNYLAMVAAFGVFTLLLGMAIFAG